MAITEKYGSRLGAGANDGSSAANAWTFAQAVTAINALGAGGAAGLRLNYKWDGTLDTQASALSITATGSTTSPAILRGYATTIGDYDIGRTNGNGAMIPTNMPQLTFTSGGLSVSSYWNVEGLLINASINGSTLSLSPSTGVPSNAHHCKLTNTGTGANANAISYGGNNIVTDCDLALTGASGGLGAALMNNAGGWLHGCRLTSTSAAAFGAYISATSRVTGCVAYRCGSHGISVMTNSVVELMGNTCVLCGGSGINIISTYTQIARLINNLLTDNTLYGINGNAATVAIVADYNRMDRNTSGATNSATVWLAMGRSNNTTSVTQAQEYVDASSNDYRLMSTSPAKGAGLLPYLDIGALQRQEGGLIVVPSMAGSAE